jgi:hypothetical protein
LDPKSKVTRRRTATRQQMVNGLQPGSGRCARLALAFVRVKEPLAQPERARRDLDQFIVVDTAPVLAVAETQTMARQADAVILVVRWGATTGDAIRIAVHELQSARITPRGVALNSVDFKAQSKYTRGDSASYYNSYSKYYSS